MSQTQLAACSFAKNLARTPNKSSIVSAFAAR
jgi:hypothetical protein